MTIPEVYALGTSNDITWDRRGTEYSLWLQQRLVKRKEDELVNELDAAHAAASSADAAAKKKAALAAHTRAMMGAAAAANAARMRAVQTTTTLTRLREHGARLTAATKVVGKGKGKSASNRHDWAAPPSAPSKSGRTITCPFAPLPSTPTRGAPRTRPAPPRRLRGGGKARERAGCGPRRCL